MKKILFAVKDMNIGGVEKSLLPLLKTIDRNEYEIDLLLLEKSGGLLEQIPDWVNLIICDSYASWKAEVNEPPCSVIKHYLTHKRVDRALKMLRGYLATKLTGDFRCYYRTVFQEIPMLDKHYDIAVSYTSIISYLTWYVMYHVSANRYIGWIHFDVRRICKNRKLLLLLHRDMDKIYVVSKAALNSFTEMFPELKEKCELRYNIVNRDEILSLAQENAESIRESEVKTIVTLGRLTAEKGQDIIPEVACKLKEKGLRFKWYIVGDGGLRGIIEQRASELNVKDEITLLGTKVNPYPYLKQADVYVQTSIHEGYCITLAEAKIFGMPIVSTEFAGAREQLEEVANATVVRRDAEQLYNAIIPQFLSTKGESGDNK